MQQIKIDFDNPGLPQRLDVVENDAQSRFFKAVLYKDGKAYTAPSGATYSIMYRGFGPQNEGWYDTINDGAGKRAACSVSGNVVTCEIARQALRVPGHVSVMLCVTRSNGYMLHGWPIDCNCRNDSYTGGTSVESFFYITQVTNADWTSAIQTWEELKNMIDPTLSLSGKAADAAKVGEAVNAETTRAKGVEGQLKEDLNFIETEYDAAWNKGKYITSNGGSSTIDLFEYTDPILIKKGTGVIFYGKGYSTNVAMISYLPNYPTITNNYRPLVISDGSVAHKYFYQATQDMYVVLCTQIDVGAKIWLFLKDTYDKINELFVAVDEINKNSNNSVKLFMPHKYIGIINKPTCVYLDSVVKGQGCQNMALNFKNVFPSSYYNETRRLTLLHKAVQNRDSTVVLMHNNVEVDKKNCLFTVIDDNNQAESKAIFIGDSITNYGYYLSELINVLPNLILYGSRKTVATDSSGTSRTVFHEGRPSWSAHDYVSASEKGNMTNPFWDGVGFNFTYYMQNTGKAYTDITDVFIMLGTNDVKDESTNALALSAMQSIVKSIKDYNSALKIHVILPPQISADESAWGIQHKQARYITHNLMIDLWGLYIDNLTDVDIIPAGLNVDTINDYPKDEHAANFRNPELVKYTTDTVHPNMYGMYNMSDVIYAHIIYTR